MNFQRLDKIISSQLNTSRSIARNDIRKGKVSVDGNIVKDPSRSVDPVAASILYCGQTVEFKEHIYLVMNKPKGVLCATQDKNKTTVVELVPDNLRRTGIFPVGRLDRDTTGLLLLTDDGDFAHRVISPKSDISKRYVVDLDAPILPDGAEKFRKGVVLADGTRCKPAELSVLEESRVLVTISEGKYHQIKRMFGTIGLGVNELQRISIGGLSLPKDILEGECRELTKDEFESITKSS